MHINRKSANAKVVMYPLHILHNSTVISQDIKSYTLSRANKGPRARHGFFYGRRRRRGENGNCETVMGLC
jgi:hypothetical protein